MTYDGIGRQPHHLPADSDRTSVVDSNYGNVVIVRCPDYSASGCASAEEYGIAVPSIEIFSGELLGRWVVRAAVVRDF
jgi:hypothetical protein